MEAATDKRARNTRRWACRAALPVLVLAAGVAGAQGSDVAMPISSAGQEITSPTDASTSAAQATPAVASTSFEAGARVYLRMARYLEEQQTFFVELASTSTISSAGQNKVSGGLSRVWYKRPGHIVWTNQSDIGASALAVEGAEATLFLPALDKYMVAPVTDESFDAQIAGMSAPFGVVASALFARDTLSALRQVVVSSPELVRSEMMLGVMCDRLKLPTRMGNVDLWVAQGPIPLPVQISSLMTIPASPGENNGVASRSDVSFRWKVNVELPDSTFKLKLPDTAVKVDKLGGPVVVAKLPVPDEKPKGKSSSRSRSREKETSSRTRAGDTASQKGGKDFGLAFEPPPSLATSSNGGNVPSLSGSGEDLVAAAIRSSRPDAVASGASYQPERTTKAPPAPSSSAQSPAVSLRMMDGKTVDLNSYRGRKAVVLDFWATWCGPCKQSMPVVSQVAQSYRARGVEFFAVNMAEDSAQVQKFIQDNGLGLAVALDADGRLARSFGVDGIPHLVVIGKDGTVKGTHTGADPRLGESLMRDLETAIR